MLPHPLQHSWATLPHCWSLLVMVKSVYFVNLHSVGWCEGPRASLATPYKATTMGVRVGLSHSHGFSSFYISYLPIYFIFFLFFIFIQSITNLTTNICEKISIQYTVLGFELTTFRTRVSSHTHSTRALAHHSHGCCQDYLYRDKNNNLPGPDDVNETSKKSVLLRITSFRLIWI